MHTKFFSVWPRLAAVVLLLLTTFTASPVQADAPVPGGIIAVGTYHTCALRPDGSIDCWGWNVYGQAEDQSGPYTQVTAGSNHTCALTPSGAVDCWGANEYGQAEDQSGPYTQVSTGYLHNCALTPSGAVDCWGYNSSGQAEDQSGPYTQVSAGLYYNCALRLDGSVKCWGWNGSGNAADQLGPYTQVSAGFSHTCALTPSGAVDCWGDNYYGQAEDQPGPYIQISSSKAGLPYTCALTPSGAVDCWGDNSNGQAEDQPGPVIQVSVESYLRTCALTPAGGVDCWGANIRGEGEDQPGPYGPYEPNIDTTPPVVTVTGVTEGSTYILGAVPQAGCSTTDEGSGVAVEASLSLSGGNTLGVGTFTATCSGALDNAGNSGNTAVVSYNVTFLFTGFLTPVDNLPVLNIARAGQVIPLKWRLTDVSGNPIPGLTDATVTAASWSCEDGDGGDSIEAYAGSSSGLQYLGDGYYQWNWKTSRSYANSCKLVSLDLGEGAGNGHTALFQFK
ncbi:MAG TPA: PxKF domain-containing protein [Anaerolineales bacterium]|nr:PxKF domain-containing protein [Anaerolineales bacterium]